MGKGWKRNNKRTDIGAEKLGSRGSRHSDGVAPATTQQFQCVYLFICTAQVRGWLGSGGGLRSP